MRLTYFHTYTILLLLLGLTFLVAHIHLGVFATLVALSIGISKAVLVALNFMHIRQVDAVTHVFALAGVIWLMILFYFTMADYASRSWTPLPGTWPQPELIQLYSYSFSM